VLPWVGQRGTAGAYRLTMSQGDHAGQHAAALAAWQVKHASSRPIAVGRQATSARARQGLR
jgi:hypothetical protein